MDVSWSGSGLGNAQSDARIGGVGLGAHFAHDERVDVQFGDLRIIGGQLADEQYEN